MKRVISVFVIIFLFSFLPSISSAMDMEGKKVIMVVVNYISIYDIDETTPNLKYITDNGGIALTNTRTQGTQSSYKAYVTIGAGSRSEGTQATTLAYNIDDDLRDTYFRRTGMVPKDTKIINTEINRLIKQNSTSDFGAVPGALGQSLRDKGLKTAVIGNADFLEEHIRPAAAIAMDSKGQVSLGTVEDDIMIEDSIAPYGVRTDYDALTRSFKEVYPTSSMVVIETGDLTRLENYRDYLAPEIYGAHRKVAMGRIDKFIGEILENLDLSSTRLYIVSPYPSFNEIAMGNRLTPTIIYGDGIEKSYLTSETTKRLGIIANIDIAPSIVDYLNTETTSMVGRPIKGVATEDSQLVFLSDTNRKIVTVSINRWPVLSSFSIFQIVLICSSVLMLLLYKYVPIKAFKAVETLLLTTMGAPIILLLLGLAPQYRFGMVILVFASLSIGFAYLVKISFKNNLSWIYFISGLTSLGIIFDVLTGSNLLKYSLFGYDPIIGARYYGVGNEFVGVVIGATMIALGALLEKKSSFKKLFWPVSILVIITMGYPRFGANVGGTITAVFSFVYLYFKLSAKKVTSKEILICFLSVVGVVSLMALVDIFLLNGSTHLARAILSFIEEGPSVILRIIYRKIDMNVRLIRVTLWSWVLLAVIFALWMMFRKPKGILLKIFNSYPYLSNSWIGVIIASIIGFLFNDSGVVVAATSNIYMATSLLLLVIGYIIEAKTNKSKLY